MNKSPIKSRLVTSDMLNRPEEENPKDPKSVVFLSVEGEITEVNYFTHLNTCVAPNDVILHIEVLERSNGSKSAPKHVFEVLNEYARIRDEDLVNKSVLHQVMGRYPVEAIEQLLAKDPDDTLSDEEAAICNTLQVEVMDFQYNKFLKRMSRGENDIAAMIVDIDKKNQVKRKEVLETLRSDCATKGYGFYITNPCFEFWLLLHLCDVATDYKDKLVNIAENKLTGKRKSLKYVAKEVSKRANHSKSISKDTFIEHYLQQIPSAISRAQCFATTWPEVLDNIGTNLPDLFSKLGYSAEK